MADKVNELREAKDSVEDNAAVEDSKKDTKNGEEEDEEESSDEEEHAGLYDKPVVIEVKRERKTTIFLASQTPQAISIPKALLFVGKGESLGSMERTNYELGRSSAVELKPLHKLLFGREGRAPEIKRNIRKFNGFVFEKDSKEYEAKKFNVERFTNDGLKRLCEIFDLEKKGNRVDLQEKVMDFLMSPKSSGRSKKSSETVESGDEEEEEEEVEEEKEEEEGKGESLGSMERTNYELGRSSAVELKPLHKLLFGREGRAPEIKRNIRKFNGFVFEKDSKEYEAKKFNVERFTNDGLKRLCEIFDLEKKGNRVDLQEKVMDFLMSPKSSGRSKKSSETVESGDEEEEEEEVEEEKEEEEGKGESLGSMERTNYELGRSSAVELKPLHKLLFGREGRAPEIKRNIRKFNGFVFEKDSKEYEAKKFNVERFTNDGLKRLCEIFDLEKKGNRVDLQEKVMDFLMSPKSSGRSKKSSETVESGDEEEEEEEVEEEKEEEEPPKQKKKTESTPKKTESPTKKSKETKAVKEKGKEKEKSKDKPKAKAKKTEEKTKASKKKEPVAVKITPLKKRSPKKTPKKEKPAPVEVDSSDEEPLAKMSKKEAPTNSDLEKLVKELLDGADLEKVTMKSICKQVYDKFPGHDLTSRKDFIKDTVRKVIS